MVQRRAKGSDRGQRSGVKAAVRRSPAFSLVLLGSPHFRDDRTHAAIAFPAKGVELVAYLILEHNRAPARRDVVAQVLWPNTERSRAIVNLRSLLARIRRNRLVSGIDVLAETREFVQLTVQATTDFDLLRELQRDEPEASVLEQCALYRGDLLDAPTVGDWVLGHRAALRDKFTNNVTRFLEAANPRKDAAVIEIVAARLLAIDPYLESSYRALMRAHAAAGRPRDLERVYRECCDRFERDLHARPSAEIISLYRSLCDLNQIDEATKRSRVNATTRAAPLQATATPKRGVPSVCILSPTSFVDSRYSDLATALLEDVTIGLCTQRAFTVIAPYTAWQLGPDGIVGDFVDQFGIGYVLQSRVHRIADGYFLAPKLVDAGSRRIIWADRFLLDDDGLGVAFGRLAQRIVRSLTEAVENVELDHLRRGAERSAYAYYLLGTRALGKVKLQDLRAARHFFKSSIRQDNRFALAHGAVAHSLVMEWLLLARRDTDLLDQAEQFARRALSLDRDQADGLRELGLCNLYQGRFDESLAAFMEAEQRAPQHADLIADHADALSLAGSSTEALSKIEDAIRLNPLCPDRYHWYRGTILYQLEQYQEAVKAISRMSDQSPAYKLFAASWAMIGDMHKAGSYAEKVRQIYPNFSVDGWLSMIPIRDVAVRDRYEQGLRASGLR